MKRKLVLAHEASPNSHEEEPESKKGKMTSHTPALLMLPYEMLGLICGFVDQIDGLRFASSCRALYRSLYENHESFMSHRMINEMKTLLTKYDRSTTKYQPHISTSIVPIMPFEKVLRFTVDNVVEDSMNQFRLNLLWNEKHKEWNRFLSNKIAPKYGVDVAKLVSANLLEKCQLISSSTDTVLNCRILKATIKIGLLKFEHYAEEVQNTETNNEKNVIWNMKVFTPGEPWGFEFANAGKCNICLTC